MTAIQKRLFNWTLVILWAGVIFYFSSQPSLHSYLPTFWDVLFRKMAHFLEYMILSWLIMRGLEKMPGLSEMYLVFIIGVLYAASDEYHQTFVYGRQGTIVDVGVDSLGALSGALAYLKNLQILGRIPK